jgi:hypothetical protein
MIGPATVKPVFTAKQDRLLCICVYHYLAGKTYYVSFITGWDANSRRFISDK